MSGTDGSPGPDEVRVQRVHRPVVGHGPSGGDQRLPGDLAAVHPLDGLVGRPAAEDVDLDLLQVEQVEEPVERVAHEPAAAAAAAAIGGNRAATKRERCRDASAPWVRAGAQESTRRTLALVTAT
jgi:hypothetical protein